MPPLCSITQNTGNAAIWYHQSVVDTLPTACAGVELCLNGQITFSKACRLGANKIPHLKWEQIVPPPFLKAWFRFLQLCENRNMQGKEIDETLAPLLPLFHCDNYCLPFRILKEKEVASLSGLHNFWTRTSIEDWVSGNVGRT